MLRVTAGHDIEYPLRSAGSAVAYYLQDGKEPPGVWAGTAAGALGLTGQVDPETYRALFGKLIAPKGERILRHSRIALTMEIYTQVPDKVTRDALRRLSDQLDSDQAGEDEPDAAGPGQPGIE